MNKTGYTGVLYIEIVFKDKVFYIRGKPNGKSYKEKVGYTYF